MRSNINSSALVAAMLCVPLTAFSACPPESANPEQVTFIGTDAVDQYSGTNRRDVVYGKGGDDVISTGGGDDLVSGHSGNDLINPGSGDDIIYGHAGNDTLIFGECYGSDRYHNWSPEPGLDRVQLTDDTNLNTTYLSASNNLVIHTANSQLIVVNHFSTPSSIYYAIENLVLPDGTILDRTQIVEALDYPSLAAYLDSSPAPEPEPEPGPEPSQTDKDIVRLLQQATFGPTLADLELIRQIGMGSWVEQQLAAPYDPTAHLDYVTEHRTNVTNNTTWWDEAIAGEAQIRYRMAHSLGQILVVSSTEPSFNNPYFIAAYHDLLNRHALGNFRDLLSEVTLSPAMGLFLSSHYNSREDPENNTRADENFARELLQLFTIGVDRLNLDGTVVTDNHGEPVKAYNQEDIKALARVFTGLYDIGADGQWLRNHTVHPTEPMIAYDEQHDVGEKIIFTGTDQQAIIPAHTVIEGSTMADIALALDIVFNHPNVAPFISKQLIKRLVTSNPTPAYVRRVAEVFENNGQGIRGDLAAVARAILLDPEARGEATGQSAHGKVKEPVLLLTNIIRALGAIPSGPVHPLRATGEVDPTERHYVILNSQVRLGERLLSSVINQAPLTAPSVFNFYRPDHRPGGEFINNDLEFPELQILTDGMWINTFNLLSHLFGQHHNNLDHPEATFENPRYVYGAACMHLDLINEREILLTDGIETLIQHLDLLFYAGSMSDEVQNILHDHLQLALDAHQNGNQRDFIRYLKESLMAVTAAPQFWAQQ